MLNKIDLENREEKILASYACLSKHSRGRAHPEEQAHNRTEFQRDRDRIIHSKAFRRLIHKTQVFIAPEKDHYRNRLTHTLEVAQIARHLARILLLNEDLAEAIGLAHDLGHTPFGHTGEAKLDELLKEHGGFEHNRQSRKVVEKLEKKYIGYDGLNLTYEVRDGLIKHRSPYDNSGLKFKHSPSLEAQITNIADEIAYNSHDTDDALTAGLISQKDLYQQVMIWRELTDLHKKTYPNLSDKELQNLNIRKLITRQIDQVVIETEKRLQENQIKNYQAVLEHSGMLVDYDKELKEKIGEMRKFLFENFYKNPKIVKKNEEAKKIITCLFKYYSKHPDEAKDSSMNYKEATEQETVGDYIAGMTDDFARKKYLYLKAKSL
jgi:dGTPase